VTVDPTGPRTPAGVQSEYYGMPCPGQEQFPVGRQVPAVEGIAHIAILVGMGGMLGCVEWEGLMEE